MNKCEKLGCIANLNGECVNDECKGEIIQMPPNSCADMEIRRKFYEYFCETFDKDFPQQEMKTE